MHVVPDRLAAADDRCGLDLQDGFCEFVDLAATGEGRSAAIAVDGRGTYYGSLDSTRGVGAGVDDNLIHVLVEGFLGETDQLSNTVQVVEDFIGVFAQLVCR